MTDPNEMAFPNEPCETGLQEWGLTKREWFAGQALGGLATWADDLSPATIAHCGRLAWALADSAIEHANKEEDPCPKP